MTVGNTAETHCASVFSSRIEMSLISVKTINKDLEFKERNTGRDGGEIMTVQNMGCKIHFNVKYHYKNSHY